MNDRVNEMHGKRKAKGVLLIRRKLREVGKEREGKGKGCVKRVCPQRAAYSTVISEEGRSCRTVQR